MPDIRFRVRSRNGEVDRLSSRGVCLVEKEERCWQKRQTKRQGRLSGRRERAKPPAEEGYTERLISLEGMNLTRGSMEERCTQIFH